MADHWLLHTVGGLARAGRLRWQTRGGFTVSREPAFHPDAVAWFVERLSQVERYIEYGSGASTLLAADRGVRTISMEGDPRYAAAVRAGLHPGAPVDVLDAGLGLTAEWSFPVFTRRTPRRLAVWRDYATRPLDHAAEEGWLPQLVLVDGRFRRSCALHAASRVVAAGQTATLLFDDYANRPHYHSVEQYLGQPEILGLSAVFDIGPESPIAANPPTAAELTAVEQDLR